MLIKVLSENEAVSDDFKKEHGLSLYLETGRHKLFFDFGAGDNYLQNAEKLGVDVAAADFGVVSHGHHDHGGGLKSFLRLNRKTKIYIRQSAFGKQFSLKTSGEKSYIGLDREIRPDERFVFTGDSLEIEDGLFLFSAVEGDRFVPSGNRNLYTERGSSLVPDDFIHEQNLLIKEGKIKLLLAGCAHRGIANIIDHLYRKGYGPVTHVIGGFHLYNPSTDAYEDPQVIAGIARCLQKNGAKYYTCHCTGLKPYRQLQEIMGKQISYLACGSVLDLS